MRTAFRRRATCAVLQHRATTARPQVIRQTSNKLLAKLAGHRSHWDRLRKPDIQASPFLSLYYRTFLTNFKFHLFLGICKLHSKCMMYDGHVAAQWSLMTLAASPAVTVMHWSTRGRWKCRSIYPSVCSIFSQMLMRCAASVRISLLSEAWYTYWIRDQHDTLLNILFSNDYKSSVQ